MPDFQTEMCVWLLQNICWELEKLQEICYRYDREAINDVHKEITRLGEVYQNEM